MAIQYFGWNRATRVPRRGLDWAVRSSSLRQRHRWSSFSYASFLLTGVITTAALVHLERTAENEPRRDPMDAFVPSRLPAFDPFARKAYKPITLEQAESFLLANQRSLKWRSGVVIRHDQNAVASNYPIEDDTAHAFIGGRSYFLLLDGHAGWQASKYLAENLIGRVAGDFSTAVPQTDHEVHSVIKNAFMRADEELLQPALLQRKAYEAAGSPQRYFEPVAERLKQVQAYDLSFAGSCALLAVCDARQDKLHVAVTGDSRAVYGMWEPTSEDGTQGVWRVQVLSEDQTGNNPKEVKRVLAEHPPEEADKIFKDGRILGLAVTRAFGDSRFKWSAEDWKSVTSMIFGSPRPPRPNYDTPPYVTASPEVVSVSLTPPHKRGFLVLASDGIWDELTNSEVVGLVGGWLDGIDGSRTREEVVALTKMGEHPPEYYMPSRELRPTGPKRFAFRDANLSTHLIRNAMAGDDDELLRLNYSFGSSGSSRYQRDDMTATVVLLGEHDKIIRSAPPATSVINKKS
ncbi:protein serine/threonine phosphatase 2C [Auriculariales sp. MPI-PUGE-AT-0066]|nr:protein serine/threonine phosphatase 2C [Auriculariales sp. MPI-PUGE-AT-0066]